MTKREKQRLAVSAAAGGFFFALMNSLGYGLNKIDTMFHIEVLVKFLLSWPCYTLITGVLLYKIPAFAAFDKGLQKGKIYEWYERLTGKKQFFLILTAVYFAAWIPCLLGSFPGIFTYDAPIQMSWYADGILNAHHPILHTWMLGGLVTLGETLFHSRVLGGLLYSLVQMVILAGCFSYVTVWIIRKKAPVLLQLGTILFFALHPAHALFSMCATKDTIFSGIFAVLLVQLADLYQKPEQVLSSRKRVAAFCITLFFFFAFRNNGFYVFLACVPFFLVMLRKYWKKAALICLIGIGIQLVYTGPVYGMLGVEKGDAREMLSMVMQPVARVYRYTSKTFTPEEDEILHRVIDEEGLQAYKPYLSDYVKNYFDTDAFLADPVSFMKMWLQVGLRHKTYYLDGMLATTHGAWYPNDSLWSRTYFYYNGKPYDERVDIPMEPVSQGLHQFYSLISEEAQVIQKIPLFSFFSSAGGCFWVLVFTSLYFIYVKRVRQLAILVPLWAYFFTILLGPMAVLRYSYPLMVCMPVLCCMMTEKGKEEKENRYG